MPCKTNSSPFRNDKCHAVWADAAPMMALMDVAQAKRDVRETFLGGFAGQLVSGVLWGISAAACTWHSLKWGEVILLLGGFFIFPVTQLVLRSMGHAYALPKGHPMNALGIQVAFTLPLTLPIVIGLALLRPIWFYPAVMIALGAHYLPFVFMYGMWQFAALCAVLVSSGLAIALYLPKPVSFGGWFTATILFAFAFVARHVALQEQRMKP